MSGEEDDALARCGRPLHPGDARYRAEHAHPPGLVPLHMERSPRAVAEHVADVVHERDELRREVAKLKEALTDYHRARTDANLVEMKTRLRTLRVITQLEADVVEMLCRTLDAMAADSHAWRRQADAWKANHDNQVRVRRALYTNRVDLPPCDAERETMRKAVAELEERLDVSESTRGNSEARLVYEIERADKAETALAILMAKPWPKSP